MYLSVTHTFVALPEHTATLNVDPPEPPYGAIDGLWVHESSNAYPAPNGCHVLTLWRWVYDDDEVG